MSWRDQDWEDLARESLATHDHGRAIVWGALAVGFLAVAGILYSLLG
jgi:hypothetical protein